MSTSLQLTPTVGRVARTLSLTTMLARPTRQGRAALLLPIIAFAVTTALLLVVVGGVQMFFTDPRVGEDLAFMYQLLSALALLLLAAPIATLGAAAARLSARRRNDRLATLRLLGASTAEVRAMTVLEAGATAGIGAVIGIALYGVLLPLVGLLPFFGGPVGATALWAGPWALLAAVAAVIVLATASAALSLRRVNLTPLGVRQRTDTPPRRLAVLFVGLGALAVVAVVVANIATLGSALGPTVMIVALLGGFGVTLLLINLIGTPIIAARGRAMARSARTAARLIAGRELAAHASVAWRRVSGIAMVGFIAVVGGAGASLAAMAESDASTSDGAIFADMRTGVLVTLAVGFVLLACSVGVTQAASVLEDRELIVGLDRLGMPPAQQQKARALTVMVPLRWAAIGGAVVGATLTLPLAGIAVVAAPVSVAIIVGTFVLGLVIVRASLWAAIPLITAVRRGR